KVGATYTDMIRTTNPSHVNSVQYIWQKLAPYIYKSTYQGWYCVGCESFVTDKEATTNNGICPDHKTPYQHLSEENYYFKTSAFSEKVRQAIVDDELQIVPDYRKKEFLDLMKEGLHDVSISRPKKNLSWGVPVPGDPTQVMYVWLDALANYITVLGYPDKPEWQQYWPADVQVVGKDIMRFHAGLWPAMLLGLGLQLPKKLLVHGFINVGGVKMSKTIGNKVDPMQVIDDYGVEAFRYYFSRHVPTQDDGDFTWEKFENAYNTELANDLGNVIQRLASMITKYQAGVIGDVKKGEHDMSAYHEFMDSLDFNKAIDDVWSMVRSLNQYIENVKPWEIAKKIGKDAEAETHLSDVLAYATASILQIGDLLLPFMPATADHIHKIFGTGVIVPSESILFPKVYKHTPAPGTPNDNVKK
ncbi:methionine--tRNA ligase, partial [Candidatus Saccharibacteria bacterium]|nr:methionine--tRNA ligase [Candidatus Saccharibacteria bacterium]